MSKMFPNKEINLRGGSGVFNIIQLFRTPLFLRPVRLEERLIEIGSPLIGLYQIIIE